MLQIYYGDGKGKTTALIGQCVRAAGAGLSVLFVQFLKDNRSSERQSLQAVAGITVLPGRERVKFTFRMTESERETARSFYCEQFEHIKQEADRYELIALDELLDAVQTGMLERDSVLRWLREQKDRCELVVTGHQPDGAIFAEADYITMMKKERHPYDKGVTSRLGIER